MAGVEAEAFADTPQVRGQWPVARRGCMRLATWVQLLVCERRVSPDGTALCMLNPRLRRGLWRAVAVLATWAALLVGLALLWRPLFWLAMLGFLAFLGPPAVPAWRSRRMRRDLKSFGPPGQSVFVHSVASVQPGSGAVVMGALAAEADRKGWTLALDTGHPRLVEYYQQFGFSPLGVPVPTPWGPPMVRMARGPVSVDD